jgi:hypothetical protein
MRRLGYDDGTLCPALLMMFISKLRLVPVSTGAETATEAAPLRKLRVLAIWSSKPSTDVELLIPSALR